MAQTTGYSGKEFLRPHCIKGAMNIEESLGQMERQCRIYRNLFLLLLILLGGCSYAKDATAASEIRFFAVGDGGTGEQKQRDVAAAIADKCSSDGCDFGLYLGDVIYQSGVFSATDSQFQTKFEEPYAAITVPIYVALGNHDYDSTAFYKGEYYTAYAKTSAKWAMPALHYAFEQGPALFMALDTQQIVLDHQNAVATQGAYFAGRINASGHRWKIAFGHHPYISNGYFGPTGGNFDTFFETYLCGKVDLYLAGHEHDLQVLPGPAACPGTYVVSGGGGRSTSRLRGSLPSDFGLSAFGFAWFRVTVEGIHLEMITADGRVRYSTNITPSS